MKVVLFDLDGTLSNPLLGFARSVNYALGEFGHQPVESSELAAFLGPPIEETFKSLVRDCPESAVEALVGKYRERYGDVGYSENVLYPGIAEALHALSDAGVSMAVCTSKRRDFAERIVAMFSLARHFRFVDGGGSGIHKWQQIEALLQQGRISGSSVMVGDRYVDMIAAHRNGLRAAGVLWGFGSRAELDKEAPHYLFDSPAELLQLSSAVGSRLVR